MAGNEFSVNGNGVRERRGNGPAEEAVERIEEHWPEARDRIHDIQERARTFDRQARSFFREHPITSVVAAMSVGYIIGRILPGR